MCRTLPSLSSRSYERYLPLLLAPLSLLIWLHFPSRTAAQQDSPLLGQGQDPVSAGVSTVPVPVYLSTILNRVLSIDEKLYRFELSMFVLTTWRDPRAAAFLAQSQVSALGRLKHASATAAACRSGALKGSPNATVLCSKAAEAAKVQDCNKACSLHYAGWTCCDGIWIPNLYFQNSVAFSQDRMVADSILPGENGTVFRVTMVQGTFSNVFDFRRYPFDSQVLKIPFMQTDSTDLYYLKSSFVGRFKTTYGLAGANPNNTASQEEVTGWKVTGMSLDCDVTSTLRSVGDDAVVTWQDTDSEDPLQFLKKAVSDPIASNASSQLTGLCTLNISVTRVTSYYIWMNIFPALLITVIAFSVFFTHPNAIDIRLSTVVTLFLALVAVQFIITDQIPKTSYNTAFGNMIIASYMILASIVLEAVVVNYMASYTEFHERQGRREEEMEGRESSSSWWSGLVEKLWAQKVFASEGNKNGTKSSSRSLSEVGAADNLKSQTDEELLHQEDGEQEPSQTPPNRRNVSRVFRSFKGRLSTEPAIGYRLACRIDKISGPCIFISYIVSVLVIFLV